MSVGSFVDDERLKLILPQACCYCGNNDLSIDHLIPKKRLDADVADNLVWSWRSCNSPKGSNDALEWSERRGKFPSLLLL